MHLLACVRDRNRPARWADLVDRLLQHPPPAFDAGRAHARRGIQGNRDDETGGMTTTRTELSQAAKLSNETGPTQIVPGSPLVNGLKKIGTSNPRHCSELGPGQLTRWSRSAVAAP